MSPHPWQTDHLQNHRHLPGLLFGCSFEKKKKGWHQENVLFVQADGKDARFMLYALWSHPTLYWLQLNGDTIHLLFCVILLQHLPNPRAATCPVLLPFPFRTLLHVLNNNVCIVSNNAQSVTKSSKRSSILDFIHDHDVDVMLLTETWLCQSGDESKCSDLTPYTPGYNLFSLPR